MDPTADSILPIVPFNDGPPQSLVEPLLSGLRLMILAGGMAGSPILCPPAPGAP